MTPPPPSRDWAALCWPDLDRDAAARWIAVLPLAATEQHGPHLPLGTDTLIAEAYLARVRALLPPDSPAVFLPVQPVGISTEHTDYRGTLTMPPAAALATWTALGEAVARAGLRKLVMVTSHGGNSAAMMLVAQELRARHRMLAVTTSWARLSSPEAAFAPEEIRDGIHGGAVETSIMLAAWPQHVRREALANFASATHDHAFRRLSIGRPAPYAWQAQDLHPEGAVGDATLASAEAGERLIDHGARAFCELLEDVARFDPAAFDRPPPGA
ncbi:MAG: creatininase [Proteobacteria bacterium]|nr:MAG: creatininase [Pseudomonadota bacterium]